MRKEQGVSWAFTDSASQSLIDVLFTAIAAESSLAEHVCSLKEASMKQVS